MWSRHIITSGSFYFYSNKKKKKKSHEWGDCVTSAIFILVSVSISLLCNLESERHFMGNRFRQTDVDFLQIIKGVYTFLKSVTVSVRSNPIC